MKCEKCGRAGPELCEDCEYDLKAELLDAAAQGFARDYGALLAKQEAVRRTRALLNDSEIWEVVVQAYLCGLPLESILGLVRGHAPIEFDL